MQTILPFPNITAETPKEQIEQLKSYLLCFREDLEFVLSNIDQDNLSESLLAQMSQGGGSVTEVIINGGGGSGGGGGITKASLDINTGVLTLE